MGQIKGVYPYIGIGFMAFTQSWFDQFYGILYGTPSEYYISIVKCEFTDFRAHFNGKMTVVATQALNKGLVLKKFPFGGMSVSITFLKFSGLNTKPQPP